MPTNADLAALYHEVWESIHVLRFRAARGGPDNFYAGVTAARTEVMRRAREHGVTERQVYRGE